MLIPNRVTVCAGVQGRFCASSTEGNRYVLKFLPWESTEICMILTLETLSKSK